MGTTELRVAHSTLHGLLTARTASDVYRLVLDAIEEQLEPDGSAIAFEAVDGLDIVAKAGTPHVQNELSNHLSPLSLQEGVYQTGQVCLLDDLTDTRSATASTNSPERPIRSFLCVPLRGYGVVFAVATAPNAFSEVDQGWLTQLAEYTSSALDRFPKTLPDSSTKANTDVDDSTRQQMQYALEVTDSYIWSLDLETDEVTTLIGPIERLFGIAPDHIEDVDSLFTRVVHPDERAKTEQLYDQLRNGEIDHFHIDHRTPPEREDVRWLTVRGHIQAENETRHLVGLATEISEQKQREEELQRQNERLERFASIVSHDLRNPLSVAQGRLELAREDCDCADRDHVAHALTRMETLIEDLLTLAREGERITDFEDVDLEETLTRCWCNVQTGEATLDINTTQALRADRSSLQQLLENLFRNAVEHGGEDVTVTVGELDDGFYIADDGPGISPAERETVFEFGYSTSTEGTGFGLSIVKEIANAHGWDITVSDSQAGGARFEISGIEIVD